MTKKQQRSLWSKLPQWAWKQGLRTNVDFAQHPDSSNAPAEAQRSLPEHCSDIKTAQVITSRIEYPDSTDMHKPVLDIDFPAQLVPSTTPGHFHLYLDREMTWAKYKALLNALADAGIIEDGYRRASLARGYTAVRLPWVRKEEQPEAPAPEEAPAAPAPQEAPQPRATLPVIDPVLRNLQGVYQNASIGNLDVGSFGANRIANGSIRGLPPRPIPNIVRYDPPSMSYTDGTNRVPIHAIRDHERESGVDIERLIERGELSATGPLWRSLLAEHGDRINRARPRPRPHVEFVDEVMADGVRQQRSPDLRQQLMEAEARMIRQETAQREFHYRRAIEDRPPRDAPVATGQPWSAEGSDPLGDIIEWRDRIAAAPPIPYTPSTPPSVADEEHPF